MNTYDKPILISYRFAAATLSAAAVIGRLSGPSGKEGRVYAITGVITTGTTTNPTIVTVGVNAAADPATVTVPVLSANDVFGSTQANTEGKDVLTADTVIELASDGGAAAGAADVTVTVGWY